LYGRILPFYYTAVCSRLQAKPGGCPLAPEGRFRYTESYTTNERNRGKEQTMSRTLTQLLDVRPGVTALVGAGGKATAMLTLAEELSKAGRRVIVTTTTHIFPPDAGRYGPVFSPEDTAGIATALERTGLAVAAGPLDERGKRTGV